MTNRFVFGFYTHARPDKSIFYVGKGYKHRAFSLIARNSWHGNVVKKYGKENIVVQWTKCDSESKAFKKEVLLISKLLKKGVMLTNQSLGGEGNSGYKPTKTQRIFISNHFKRLWKTKSYREKTVASLKNKTFSKQYRKNLSLAIKKAWKDPEKLARNKASLKRIYITKSFKKAHSNRMKQRWKNPKSRVNLLKGLKKLHSSKKFSNLMKNGQKKRWSKKSERLAQSKRSKDLWKDPKYRKTTISKMKGSKSRNERD